MGDVTLVRAETSHPRAVLDIGVYEDETMSVPRATDEFRRAPQLTPTRAPPRRAPPPPPRPPPPMLPDELGEFANPTKVANEYDEPRTNEYDDDEDDVDDGNGGGHEDEYGGQQYDEYDDDDGPDLGGGEQQYREPPVVPTPPFNTLEEERADLMYKLSRAARLSNINVKSFAYNADIRELRTEIARVKAEQDVTASIAFQRQLLMTICSGLEFANRKFSVMDLNLDGWSETVMEDIGKYDRIFEKLHAKHAGRFNMPPEVELILMMGGSAVTWHLTHTLLTNNAPKSIAEPAKRKKKRKATGPPRRRTKQRRREPSSDEEEEEDLDETVEERFARVNGYPKKPGKTGREMRGPGREMRGPGFDVGALMSMAPMPAAPASVLPAFPDDPGHIFLPC